MSSPSKPQVNSFLKEIQRGHLPDQSELQSLLRSTEAAVTSPPSLGAILRTVNRHGDTAFLVAARHGHAAVLKALHRSHGVLLEHSNADGKTAMHEAAQNGQTGCIEYLIGEGAQVDSLKRADWCVPVMLAKHVGGAKDMLPWMHPGIIPVDHGASLCLTNKDGWTPFHLACREGTPKVVKFFLDKNPRCWDTCSKNGRTPLHTAALHGKLEVIKILYERCPYNADSADSCGHRPLTDAAQGNHVDVMEFLLETWQANLFAEDVMGRRALHHAAEAGAVEAIQYLARRKVDVNRLAGVNHISPLHYAAKEGHSAAIMMLLSLGANPSLLDKRDRTALDVARGARDSADAVRLLEQVT